LLRRCAPRNDERERGGAQTGKKKARTDKNDKVVNLLPIIFYLLSVICSHGGLVGNLSQEEFFSGKSKLRNPEIMRIFRDMELVERLGSGMQRILKAYDRSIFKITDNFLVVSFPFDLSIDKEEAKRTKSKGKSNRESKGERKRESKRESKGKSKGEILRLLQKNSNITVPEIAVLLGISEAGVEKNIRALKKDNMLKRIGAKKGGYWKVIDASEQKI
jgi:predicted HTH transcriptional regulator